MDEKIKEKSLNLIAGDGMKNGLSRSEQRTGSRTQKQPLDRKSPIQVSCELVPHGFGVERAGMLRIAYLHGVEDAVLQQAGPIISPSRNLPFFTRLHSAPWPPQLNNCASPDIDSTQGVSATCVGTQKCD